MDYNEAKGRFITYLEAKGDSPRTVQTYEQRLRLLLEVMNGGREIDLGEISPERIDEWIVTMRRANLSRDTIRSRVRDAKHFFRWCVSRGYLERSPAEHMRLPGGRAEIVVKAMEPEDLKAMLNAISYPRDKALLLFIASTGCRSGEAATLRISSLNLAEREARIAGKTGSRVVDFDNKTALALSDWLQTHPNVSSDFVFVGLKAPHPPVTPNTIYQIYRRLAQAAGISGRFNPHAVRHLVGQIWTDRANLELTRQKLGHKQISTTMVYANQDRGRLKQYTDEIDLTE